MLWVFVVRALAWCSHKLEISSIHTGEQIKNNIFLKIQAKDLVRERLRYISQNDRLPLLSLFAFAGHYEKFSFLMYDSWSALPSKYDPAQNRISTFPRFLLFFPGFSLLSPERSFLTVFAGVQDVAHPVFHVSIKWEAALLVYHFVVGQRLVLAFLLICISVI